MQNISYFKVLLESLPDYRMIVSLVFLFHKDKNFLRKIGFRERDINRLNLEFEINLREQHLKKLDYVKND